MWNYITYLLQRNNKLFVKKFMQDKKQQGLSQLFIDLHAPNKTFRVIFVIFLIGITVLKIVIEHKKQEGLRKSELAKMMK